MATYFHLFYLLLTSLNKTIQHNASISYNIKAVRLQSSENTRHPSHSHVVASSSEPRAHFWTVGGTGRVCQFHLETWNQTQKLFAVPSPKVSCSNQTKHLSENKSIINIFFKNKRLQKKKENITVFFIPPGCYFLHLFLVFKYVSADPLVSLQCWIDYKNAS